MEMVCKFNRFIISQVWNAYVGIFWYLWRWRQHYFGSNTFDIVQIFSNGVDWLRVDDCNACGCTVSKSLSPKIRPE